MGNQKVYRYANGYGASVVDGSMLTGSADCEIAVLRYNDAGQWTIAYDTLVTEDVIRCDAEEVSVHLAMIEGLLPDEGDDAD